MLSSGVLRQMRIGDLVTWQGRAYYLRGLEPMSVPDRRVQLEDAETGEAVTAPFREVHEGGAPETPPGLTQHP
jgi:hypothetical protein